MPVTLLHQTDTTERLVRRLEALTPGATRAWGKMSVDQMLWHVNSAMRIALGRQQSAPLKAPPVPLFLVKFFVLSMPWPKGVPTGPDLIARSTYNFESEKSEAITLARSLGAQPLDASWPRHPLFGAMTGRDWSRLMAKHLDHHLRQFSV